MSEREFELYLSLMSKLLRLGPQQTEAIADELRDHFDERFDALCRQGIPREQAIRQALEEFGDAAGLAADFAQLARTRRRRLVMRCTLATVLLGAAGLFVIQALTPPNAILQGPPLAQAQGDEAVNEPVGDSPAAPLSVDWTITSIDPAVLVPDELARKATWEFSEIPLSEFLNEAAQRIGFPLVIDAIGLSEFGISLDTPVSDHLRDDALYLVLDRVLSQLDLDWFVEEGVLHVTNRETARLRLRSRSYLLSDLIDAGHEVEALQQAIRSLPGAQWQDEDGEGGAMQVSGDALFVRQTRRGQMVVEALLMALRGDARESFLLAPPSHQAIRSALKGPISVSFAEVPLEDAMASIGRDTEIDIRLDREALTDSGIPADEPLSLTLQDKSVRTVLDILLQPLHLTAVPHQGVLLVTSIPKANEMMQSVVYNVSDLCQTASESTALKHLLIQQTRGPWLRADGTGGTIEFPASHSMLVTNSESVLPDVRQTLVAFHEARQRSKERIPEPVDPEEMDIRFYRMPFPVANELVTLLPKFVSPATWSIDPENTLTDPLSNIGSLRTVVVGQDAMLLIRQRNRVHDEIEDFLKEFEEGLRSGEKWMREIEGNAGGGFFSVP